MHGGKAGGGRSPLRTLPHTGAISDRLSAPRRHLFTYTKGPPVSLSPPLLVSDGGMGDFVELSRDAASAGRLRSTETVDEVGEEE